jgi:DNA repair protein RecO (recombination protein O)
VLRQRDLAEADRIVTLLTRERGKLSAVAKGVKRPRSKLSAALQPFCHSAVLLAEGRSLDVVSQARIVRFFHRLREDLTRVTCASHLVELTDRLVAEHAPAGQVFDLLRTALCRLEEEGDPELHMRAFELKLLRAVGYEPHFSACAQCGASTGGDRIIYSAATGGVLCVACQTGASRPIVICPGTVAAACHLLASTSEGVERLALSPQVRGELEAVLRAHAEYRIEGPLRNARFLRRLSTGSTP